ncbi:MAG: helix-turn-helix domain-containing protein [Mariprofundaceae bacterium]|nr:helix-turn-helix domain-containing protein [Mariprofundaceae bacterium]
MTEETSPEKNTEKPAETREKTLQYVAEILKNKRLDCSMSMSDAAKKLNIRIHYLQALESGDWSPMPEDVYALGFLRQYAKYLKCNISDDIDKLKSNQYSLNKPVTFPDPPIAPNRKWMIIFFVALIVLLIAFNVLNQRGNNLLPSQMMQEHAANLNEKPIVSEHKNTSQIPQEIPIVSKLSSGSEASSVKAKKSSSDILIVPNNKPTPPKQDDKIKKNTQPSTAPSTQNQAKKKMMHDYVFTARSDDVWLQIYQQGKTGKPLREALLKLGQSLKLTSHHILSVTCGKPLALEISMDRHIIVASGTMAKTNQVVRHFILPRPVAE